jgi:hypothetical protein
MTKQNPKMLSIKKKDVQLFKFIFSVKEGEIRFTVVWHQIVNSVGKIEGIGHFAQQNSSRADQKSVHRRRRVPGAGMKKRILDSNRKYKFEMMVSNGSKIK